MSVGKSLVIEMEQKVQVCEVSGDVSPTVAWAGCACVRAYSSGAYVTGGGTPALSLGASFT